MRRRTLIAGAAWSVPAAAVVAAAPAFAQSPCYGSRDEVHLLARDYDATDEWTNAQNVLGWDGQAAVTTLPDAPPPPPRLEVGDFQVPLWWDDRVAVRDPAIVVRSWVDTTQFNPNIHVYVDYGDGNPAVDLGTPLIPPTTDEVHSNSFDLDAQKFMDIPNILGQIQVWMEPLTGSGGATTFFVDQIFLSLSYDWDRCPTP